MPARECQVSWGYLSGVGRVFVRNLGGFCDPGVDNLRSLVYACLDNKVYEGL